MRQASALTILVPSSGLLLVKWNKALPRLIKISTSIATTRYLNTTVTHRLNGVRAVYRVNQSRFPHLCTQGFHDSAHPCSDRDALIARPLAIAPRRRETRVVRFVRSGYGQHAPDRSWNTSPAAVPARRSRRTLRSGPANPDRQHGQCRARRLFRDHALRTDGRWLGAGESRLGAPGSEPRSAANHPRSGRYETVARACRQPAESRHSDGYQG